MLRVANPDVRLTEEIRRNDPVYVLFQSHAETTNGFRYQVTFYGIIHDGRKVSVTFEDVVTYVHVRIPAGVSEEDLFEAIKSSTDNLSSFRQDEKISYEVVWGKRAKLHEEEEVKYMRINFASSSDRKKVVERLSYDYQGCPPNMVGINGVDYRLEIASNRDKFETFCCDRGLDPAGWMKLNRYHVDKENKYNNGLSFGFIVDDGGDAGDKSVPQSIVKAEDFDGDKLKYMHLIKDKTLIMGLDIETYSDNEYGLLPGVNDKDDFSFDIGLQFMWNHTDKPFKTFSITTLPEKSAVTFVFSDPDILKRCDENGVLRLYVPDQRQLLIAMIMIMHDMKPDICLQFNGGEYDWPFLWERLKQYTDRSGRPLVALFKEKVSCLPYKYYGEKRDYLPFTWTKRAPRLGRPDYSYKPPHASSDNYKFLNREVAGLVGGTIKIDAQDPNHDLSMIKVPGMIDVDVRMQFMKIYNSKTSSSLNFFLAENKLGLKEDMHHMTMHRIVKLVGLLKEKMRKDMSLQGNRDPPSKKDSSSDPFSKNWHDVAVSYLETRDLNDALFVHDGKPVTGHEMKKTLAMTTDIITYCEYDALACWKLMKKRNMITDKRSIASRSTVTLANAFMKADTAKIFNMACQEFSQQNLFVDALYRPQGVDDKYPGAKVVEPKKGLYAATAETKAKRLTRAREVLKKYTTFKDVPDASGISEVDRVLNSYKNSQDYNASDDVPVEAIDVNSLYPSMMQAFGLSPENIIRDHEYAKRLMSKVDPATGEKYVIREIRFPYGKVDVHSYVVVTPQKDGSRRGVFCKMLRDLGQDRLAVKRQMKAYELCKEMTNKLLSKDIAGKVWEATFRGEEREARQEECRAYAREDAKRRVADGEITRGDLVKVDKVKAGELYTLMNTCSVMNKKREIEFVTSCVEMFRDETSEAMRDPKKKKFASNQMEGIEAFEKFFVDAFTNPTSNYACDQGSLKGFMESVDFYFNYYNAKQLAVKVFMNTMYGATGYQKSPLFMVEIAGATTTYGRSVLEKIISELEAKGYRVVYGDTDSAYVMAPAALYADVKRRYMAGEIDKEAYWTEMVETSIEDGERLVNIINSILAEFTSSRLVRVAFEESLFPAFFLGKKKYAGVQHPTVVNLAPCLAKTQEEFDACKNVFIRGLELKKKNTSGLSRKLSKEVLYRVFNINNEDTAADIVFDVLEGVDDRMRNNEFKVKEFVKTAKYKKAVGVSSKTGKPKTGNVSANRFVERMTLLSTAYPHMQIEPPKYGETISYVVKKTALASYDMRGRKVPTKMGDRWEYLESFDNAAYKDMLASHGAPLEVDTSYYMLREVMAIMARFTSYDPIYRAYTSDVNNSLDADYEYDFSEDKDEEERPVRGDEDMREEGEEDYFEKDQAEQKQAKALLTKIYMKGTKTTDEVSKRYKEYYKTARSTIVLTTAADENVLDAVEMMYDYDGLDAYIREKEKRCSEKAYVGLSNAVDAIGRIVTGDGKTNANDKKTKGEKKDEKWSTSASGAQYLLYKNRVSGWARAYDALKNKCVADMKMSYKKAKEVLGEYGVLMDQCVTKFRDEADDGDMFEILDLSFDGALDEHVERFVNAKMLFDGAVDMAYRMARLKSVAETMGQVESLAKSLITRDDVSKFLKEDEKKPLERNAMLDHLRSLRYG